MHDVEQCHAVHCGVRLKSGYLFHVLVVFDRRALLSSSVVAQSPLCLKSRTSRHEGPVGKAAAAERSPHHCRRTGADADAGHIYSMQAGRQEGALSVRTLSRARRAGRSLNERNRTANHSRPPVVLGGFRWRQKQHEARILCMPLNFQPASRVLLVPFMSWPGP